MSILKVLPALSLVGVGLYKYFQLPQQDITKIQKLLYKDGKPVILAHRAGQFEAPENTLVAIDTSFRNGASAVEVDLDFTSDGVAVLMHDDTVDRTTDGSGLLSSYTFEDIRKLNAADDHLYITVNNVNTPHNFEKVPTLQEAVEKCIKRGMTMDLDVKSDPEKVVRALRDTLNQYPDAPDYVFVSSFYPHYIYSLRKECPEFSYGLIWRPWYISITIAGKPRYSWLKTMLMTPVDILLEHLVHHWAVKFLGISLVVINKCTVSENYLKSWKQQNVEMIAWTVNNPAQKDYFLNYLQVPIVTDSVLNSKECDEQAT